MDPVAAQAIKWATSTGSVMYAPDNDDTIAALLNASDSFMQLRDVLEVWGRGEDGKQWCVHVRRKRPAG